MKNEIGDRLKLLREEHHLSQKEAASRLGISQALLSHYENGIRECSLSFVINAARFYDVSADFLLGLSEKRRSYNDLTDPEEIPSDGELKEKTLFRALTHISDKMNAAGEAAGRVFTETLLISIYRFLLFGTEIGVADDSWLSLDAEDGWILTSRLPDVIRIEREYDITDPVRLPPPPKAIRTVIRGAEDLIRSEYARMLEEY